MKPIKAPSIVNTGIVIYVPTQEDYRNCKLEIFYSPKNPLFSYSHCEPSPSKIWEKKDISYDKGSLFIYSTNKNLARGFYKIHLTIYNINQTKFIEGAQTYGLLKEKPTLYIGLPYSSFGPILAT